MHSFLDICHITIYNMLLHAHPVFSRYFSAPFGPPAFHVQPHTLQVSGSTHCWTSPHGKGDFPRQQKTEKDSTALQRGVEKSPYFNWPISRQLALECCKVYLGRLFLKIDAKSQLVSMPELREILSAQTAESPPTFLRFLKNTEKHHLSMLWCAIVFAEGYTQSISIDVICVSIRPNRRVVGKLPILLLFSLQFFFSGAKALVFPLARSSTQSKPTK